MNTQKIPFRSSVRTEADAKRFLRTCCDLLQGGFHPDTPFGDYLHTAYDKTPVFSPREAKRLDGLMAAAFNLLGDDVYDYALGYMVEKYGWPGPGMT